MTVDSGRVMKRYVEMGGGQAAAVCSVRTVTCEMAGSRPSADVGARARRRYIVLRYVGYCGRGQGKIVKV